MPDASGWTPGNMWGDHSLLRHWQAVFRRDDDLAVLGEPWSHCEEHIDRHGLAEGGHDLMLVWVTVAPDPGSEIEDLHHVNWGYIGGSSVRELLELAPAPGSADGMENFMALEPASATR